MGDEEMLFLTDTMRAMSTDKEREDYADRCIYALKRIKAIEATGPAAQAAEFALEVIKEMNALVVGMAMKPSADDDDEETQKATKVNELMTDAALAMLPRLVAFNGPDWRIDVMNMDELWGVARRFAEAKP